MSNNFVQKATGASPTGLADSLLFDDGTNVGIGTTSPVVELHISRSGDNFILVDSSSHTRAISCGTNNGGTAAYFEVSQDRGTASKTWQMGVFTDDRLYIGHPGETEKITVLTGGNVGIGTTVPSARLHVSLPEDGRVLISGGPTTTLDMPANDAQISLGDPEDSNDPKLGFYSRGRGASNGYDSWFAAISDGTGTTLGNGILRATTWQFQIYTPGAAEAGDRHIKFRDSQGASIITHQSGGGITFATNNSDVTPGNYVRLRITNELDADSTVYTEGDGQTLTTTTPSGSNYKEDIHDFDPDISRLFDLPLKSFTWKESHKQDIGFIAEDIREMLPGLYRENRGVVGWKADRFHFYLFQALKDLKRRLDTLEHQTATPA